MLSVEVCLNFDGQAETAFEFYRQVFGGEFSAHKRYQDAPYLTSIVPPCDLHKILHIKMAVAPGYYLCGNDIVPALGDQLNSGNAVSLSINTETYHEAARLMRALGQDGLVDMPLGLASWGGYFGSLIDQFGVIWKINYNPS